MTKVVDTAFPRLVSLSDDKKVYIQRALKGRDQLRANKLSNEPDEVPFWLITFVVTLDEAGTEPLLFEELMDMDLFDLLAMQNEVLAAPKSVNEG